MLIADRTKIILFIVWDKHNFKVFKESLTIIMLFSVKRHLVAVFDADLTLKKMKSLLMSHSKLRYQKFDNINDCVDPFEDFVS